MMNVISPLLPADGCNKVRSHAVEQLLSHPGVFRLVHPSVITFFFLGGVRNRRVCEVLLTARARSISRHAPQQGK